ncbi:30S ribosomal protein S6 [Mycoplasma crocodyli]|uniref:30S ribosomal protein S6 n=1 Tax=Mycoplasma crocodyli TaxID=50052 RepID=UPI0002EBC2E7|nr:30S ribosomal protein S6 [Mycoplasma crocodyli]
MAKYEIVLILDPKAEANTATKLLDEVFGKGVKKTQKLEKTELAYEINKSKHAHYYLAEVEAKPELIAEFSRKANILKTVWRNLVVNLDSEKGLNISKNKKQFVKKPFVKSFRKDEQSTHKREYTPRARIAGDENSTAVDGVKTKRVYKKETEVQGDKPKVRRTVKTSDNN